MRTRTVRSAVAVSVFAVTAALATATSGSAGGPDGPALSGVPTANETYPGYAPATKLSGELAQQVVAQGSVLVENPSNEISTYGYDNDVTAVSQRPQMVPTSGNSTHEAHKTEPDKNTYLVFPKGLSGADANYDYGTHFLFQGHESAATGFPGYITRVNLDADSAHRVTVLATKDANGHNLNTIDGSTWDPWTQQLVFATENANGAEYAAGPGYPSTVTDISGAIGRGGYEGVQFDSDGNLWIVEDIGGCAKSTDAPATPPIECPTTNKTTAKRPNSFVYRFVPTTAGGLTSGKLQVLQALSNEADHHPITYESQAVLNNPDQMAIYSYGSTLQTKWVTIHDTATNGNAPYNANTLAKTAGGTPFKRPENSAFAPESHFGEFFFTVTGDTNTTSVENASAGGWGSLMKLTQTAPSASTGQLTMFYKGDQAHTGLDNITFLSRDQVTAGEDAGKPLHDQRNGLDSAFVWDVTADYSHGQVPVRWIAEGRDASATLDASNGTYGNDDDNELTGIFVSDGDIKVDGLLGQHKPDLHADGDRKWRWFYTQQHGDNNTFEVLLLKKS